MFSTFQLRLLTLGTRTAGIRRRTRLRGAIKYMAAKIAVSRTLVSTARNCLFDSLGGLNRRTRASRANQNLCEISEVQDVCKPVHTLQSSGSREAFMIEKRGIWSRLFEGFFDAIFLIFI